MVIWLRNLQVIRTKTDFHKMVEWVIICGKIEIVPLGQLTRKTLL